MKTLLLFVAIALSINVFGQDVKTVKIGDLEVMTEDLGEMEWKEAKKACADLGDDWRLPTKDELNLLYENKEKIGGFDEDFSYWSSTEYDNGIAGEKEVAWGQNFNNGDQTTSFKFFLGSNVRAVRSIE